MSSDSSAATSGGTIGERGVAVVAGTLDTYGEVSKCGGILIGGGGKLGTNTDIFTALG